MEVASNGLLSNYSRGRRKVLESITSIINSINATFRHQLIRHNLFNEMKN